MAHSFTDRRATAFGNRFAPGDGIFVRVFQIIIGLTLLSLSAWSVRAQPPEATANANSAGYAWQPTTDNGDEYRMGPGDELSIDVFGKPQLSRVERVDMRGMIRMPLIDEDIQAACKTEKGLAEEIARFYRSSQLLKNPVVSVSIKDYQSQPVAVMGSVKSPGRFMLRRRVRLLELVYLHAGGPTEGAGGRVEILSTALAESCEGSRIRPTSEGQTRSDRGDRFVSYSLDDLKPTDDLKNPYVHPGDIINIPAAEQAIVVGNVLKPSVVPLLAPTTLARAIALAGGTLPNSKKDKIRITRQSPGSTSTEEFFIDLKEIDKTKGENFLLRGGDIVEVSTKTGLQAILASLAKSIVPMASSLPLIVIH